MDLDVFIKQWCEQYNTTLNNVEMFQSNFSKNWSEKQQKVFVKSFYHARGHFHDFLWYVGNHASDKETKDIVISNISEELNGSAMSHEQMYFEFANSLGVDVSEEFISELTYVDFLKKFNHGHLEWLHTHDVDERFAAFAAYEKLDNLDYNKLLDLVKRLRVPRKGQVFFKVHSLVEHFSPTIVKLEQIWHHSNDKIRNAFDFIGKHQINMWTQLSQIISNSR